MAYKNSGAMKFNDAADLVIRADPDGTVESVYNLADNKEYINEYSNLTNTTVVVTNNSASSKTLYWPRVYDNMIEGTGAGVNAGATTSSYNIAVNGILVRTGSGVHWTIISGEAEIIDAARIKVIDTAVLSIDNN